MYSCVSCVRWIQVSVPFLCGSPVVSTPLIQSSVEMWLCRHCSSMNAFTWKVLTEPLLSALAYPPAALCKTTLPSSVWLALCLLCALSDALPRKVPSLSGPKSP